MNPLSPLTYYRRHGRSALVQMALIALATMGLLILVGVLDAIPLRADVSYLTRLSRVIPAGGTFDPAVAAQIRAHPAVERVVPDNGLEISLPTLIGTDSQRLMGVSPEDARFLLQHCGVCLKEGRMFEPRSNEFVLSEEIARALDLELGSEIGREVDEYYYETVPASLVLVGILEGDPAAGSGASVRLGFVSDEYLNSHELYAFRTTALLVAAREGRKDAVDDYLETTIHSRYAEVETFALIVEFLKAARVGIYVIFGAVNSVVSIAIALVVGIINRIAIGRRLGEFGLLHALGRRRGQLIRRMTLETATVAGAGSLVGLGVALLIMQGLKGSLFYDLGMELNVLNPSPFYFVLPIPLITVALTMLSVRRTFARLDAVAIVERGKLSEESKERRAVKRSSARPLSFHTFYLRHRRRGVLMVLGAALMILGVTLPVFLLSGMTSAMEPYMDYLQHVSIISPVQAGLDPGVVGQVRSHPAVERTMPVMSFAVQMVLPPSGGTDIKVFGVAEADLPVLLELFGVQVQQGRLPRPRSNDIVLSSAVAANRGLEVGDVIGGEVETGGALVVDNLPTEMVVAGILSPDRPWIGLVSYEFLQSHELTSSQSPRLLVIPREGEKQALDRWLETGVDSTQTHIITYGLVESEYRQMTASIILVFALLECMIAVVAAVALATLNHIFFAQRREEFGILNAIGRGRRWLVSRTMKETGSVIGVAWIIGAALCGVCLLCWQAFVYAPRGLVIDFGNPAPWLLTLPIPLAAALASVGAVAWVLSRLDPVAVVERRE